MNAPRYLSDPEARYYVLKHRRPYRCGIAAYTTQQASRGAVIGEDEVADVRIVTRFVGRNLGALPEGETAWFETRILGEIPGGELLARYATWGEAKRAHRLAVMLFGGVTV